MKHQGGSVRARAMAEVAKGGKKPIKSVLPPAPLLLVKQPSPAPAAPVRKPLHLEPATTKRSLDPPPSFAAARREPLIRRESGPIAGLTKQWRSGVENSAKVSIPAMFKFSVAPAALEGFRNTGNTCYLNSVLSALLHVPAFVHVLQSKETADRIEAAEAKARAPPLPPPPRSRTDVVDLTEVGRPRRAFPPPRCCVCVCCVCVFQRPCVFPPVRLYVCLVLRAGGGGGGGGPRARGPRRACVPGTEADHAAQAGLL